MVQSVACGGILCILLAQCGYSRVRGAYCFPVLGVARVLESSVILRWRRSSASGSCGPNSTLTCAVKCNGFDHCPDFSPSEETSSTDTVFDYSTIAFSLIRASICADRLWRDRDSYACKQNRKRFIQFCSR